MKRVGNIFDSVCTLDNLYIAHTKARKGKAKRYGVVLFEQKLDENIRQLQQELLAGTYKTSAYDVFTILDPKERIVHRLPFRDRVVHHAIVNILEPIWTTVLIEHTYSCIKGRGIHQAVRHIERDIKDKKQAAYCLKLDIKKFYPSINHDVLKTIIRRKIKDNRLLLLLDGIIDSAPGIPIGNYLSQFFANLYLSYFDHWIKEEKRVKHYYRYADDIVVLAENKPYLHGLLAEISGYLTSRLKLQVKGNYQVFPVVARGIDFVGYVFYHQHTLLRKSIKKHLCQCVAKLNKRDIPVKEYRQRICSWLGWAKHCNSKHLLKTIIPHEEIR